MADAIGRARAIAIGGVLLAAAHVGLGLATSHGAHLRLIDPNGRPSVKLAMSEQGAGLALVGEADATQVILKAEGTESSLKLANRDGRQQLIKP